MRRLGVVALVFGVLVTAAGAAPTPGGGGRIVFVSNRAPDLERVRFAAVTPTGLRTLGIGIAPAGAALAPDRQRYAYVDFESAARTWRLLVGTFGGGAPHVVATHTYGIENPVWSPTGDRIAYTALNPASCHPGDHLCVTFELWLVSSAGGDARKLADHAAGPVWSPDGKQLAFAGEYETYAANDGWKGRPWVASASGAAMRRIVNVYGVDRISWSPRADRVIVSAHRGFAVIVPLAGGKARKVVSARAAVWSPGGDAIALARDSRIVLVGPNGSLIRVLRTAGRVEEIGWSPNAARLAYVVAIPRSDTVPRTFPRRALVTVAATGRNAHTVARFDRFQLAKLLGWLREGYVLYQTWREVNDFELFSMNPDGSGLTQLTDDDVHQFGPTWSPDGRRIVFTQWDDVAQRGELRSLAVGGASTPITTPPAGASDLEAAWSPDGTLIAFSRYIGSDQSQSEIFVVHPDGTWLAQVTHAGGAVPAWWPDSRRLVFSRRVGFQMFLFTVSVDGSGERPLFQGVWGVPSKDGWRIAYVAQRAANAVGLWIANADGSDARLVADDPYGLPSWSPDGTRLAFQRFFPQTRGSVVSVGVADRDEVVLADVGADDREPDWSRLP